MDNELSLDEFLEKKIDFSRFLVHLTKDGTDELGNPCVSAREVLDCILDEHTLKAVNHFCYFSKALNSSQSVSLQDKFRVVCFTETPIEQIGMLLSKVKGRNFRPEPYGLVFEKNYIREQGVIQYSM